MWLGVLDGEITSGSCAFSGTDNTSAVGWTRKSSFADSSQEPHIIISRFLARLTMDHNFCLHTQHFASFLNVVADALSRDFYPSDAFLAHLLFYFYPDQLPPTFQISPLPDEIISFITGTLEASLVHPVACPRRQRSTIGAGLVGVTMPENLDLELTHSWTSSHLDTWSFSSAPLPVPSEQGNLADRLSTIWREVQSKRPWSKWLRASGQVIDPTQGMTPLGK